MRILLNDRQAEGGQVAGRRKQVVGRDGSRLTEMEANEANGDKVEACFWVEKVIKVAESVGRHWEFEADGRRYRGRRHAGRSS